MPTPLDAFRAQIRPSRKRVVNRGRAIEDNSLFRTEQSCGDERTRDVDAISAEFYILYAHANGRSRLEPAAAIQIGKARFPPDSAVRAYTVRVGFGEGFRMPARRDYSRALRGPASESPPGRNPRAAGWTVAVYGDLTGQRLGLEVRSRS